MRAKRIRLLTGIGLSMTLLAVAGRVRAEDWLVGMSGPLTGPSQALGLGMKTGIEAYFALVNAVGGIHGRRLRLIALDDGAEPARAAANVRKFLDDDHVFAIVGNPGTSTAIATMPIAIRRHVPFFGALTGAALLRPKPPYRYVLNLRASYAQETEAIIGGLVQELGFDPEQITFVTQDDAYGDAGFKGALAALKALGYSHPERLVHVRYPSHTVDVEGAVAGLLDPTNHARAVVLIGEAKPCAKFIRLARQHGVRALFVNVSSVVGESLRLELGDAAEGVVVTEVVPPLDADLPVLTQFRHAVPEADRNAVSLEGFLVARAFVAGLERVGPQGDAEHFITALEWGGALDLGLGHALQFSPTHHQLSDMVWPTIVGSDGFHALARWQDALGDARGAP